MKYLLTGGSVFRNGRFERLDVAIDQGRIVSVSPSLSRTPSHPLQNCSALSNP